MGKEVRTCGSGVFNSRWINDVQNDTRLKRPGAFGFSPMGLKSPEDDATGFDVPGCSAPIFFLCVATRDEYVAPKETAGCGGLRSRAGRVTGERHCPMLDTLPMRQMAIGSQGCVRQ